MIALIELLSMVATRKIRRRWNYFFPRFFTDIIYPIISTCELIIYKYINKTIFYAKEGLLRTQRLYLLNPSGDYRKYLESGRISIFSLLTVSFSIEKFVVVLGGFEPLLLTSRAPEACMLETRSGCGGTVSAVPSYKKDCLYLLARRTHSHGKSPKRTTKP
jgi:hypothetical protein